MVTALATLIALSLLVILTLNVVLLLQAFGVAIPGLPTG